MSQIPVLGKKHSGIPQNLLHKAEYAKRLIDETTTKTVKERQRLPVIPQGIGRDQFFKAIKDLSSQIGQENVEVNDKPLKDGWYLEHPNTHDAFMLLDDEETVASAVVYPGSTAEVQQVVLWANKYRIPIYPISMGRNLGYGGAAPRVRGSVVIDLGRRMNKILEIDPDACTCLVEPGVSFYALYNEIQSRGEKFKHLWIDTPDLGGGSLVGNALDHGVGYTPYGDHWGTHSGLEVVLPTGEIVRTGMGALPGNNTWQAFPYGFGPYSDGIFSQSNFGVVTKMGFALMPDPGGHESFMYVFPKEDDLEQIIEIIRPLRISNILENVAQLRHIHQQVAILGKPRSEYYKGPGTVPEHVYHDLAKTLPHGDCTWLYYGTQYGPPEIRKYKLDIIHKEFMKVPGARRIDPTKLPKDDYFWSRDRIASGTPDFEELLQVNWWPNGGHIGFSPVSPIRGKEALKLFDLTKRRHEEFGLDVFPAFIVGLREMHLVNLVTYDRGSEKSKQAVMDMMQALVNDAAKEGYGEYRTHLLFQDQVAGTYNWNDNALMKFHEKIKDALDPAGILAPGRSGIWPARYRGRGWEMPNSGRRQTSEGDGVAPTSGTRL